MTERKPNFQIYDKIKDGSPILSHFKLSFTKDFKVV